MLGDDVAFVPAQQRHDERGCAVRRKRDGMAANALRVLL